jgi:hypothetical protein
MLISKNKKGFGLVVLLYSVLALLSILTGCGSDNQNPVKATADSTPIEQLIASVYSDMGMNLDSPPSLDTVVNKAPTLKPARKEGANPVPGDQNSDGFVDLSELIDYINQWNKGKVDVSDVLEAIDIWETFSGSEDGSFTTHADASDGVLIASVSANGRYYINDQGNEVGFRFDKLHATAPVPASAMLGFTVLSERDQIDFNYYRYRDAWTLQTFMDGSSTELSWDFLGLAGLENEGWIVRVIDGNNDNYIKVRLESVASVGPIDGGDTGRDPKILEIRW